MQNVVQVGKACDEGESLFTEHGESGVAEAYRGVVKALLLGLGEE